MEKYLKYTIHFLLFKVVLKNFLRLFVGISFPNSNTFPVNGQCIYVANHNSHLDTAAFLAMIPMKNHLDAHPIAANDYFGKSKMARAFFEFFFNTLLIERKGLKNFEKSMGTINQALNQNKSILLFPEGSRGEPEIMGQFKNGIAYILKTHPTIPFVPIYMQGLGKAMPKGDSVIIPHDSKVIVGNPILIPEVTELSMSQITAIVKQSILDLENLENH